MGENLDTKKGVAASIARNIAAQYNQEALQTILVHGNGTSRIGNMPEEFACAQYALHKPFCAYAERLSAPQQAHRTFCICPFIFVTTQKPCILTRHGTCAIIYTEYFGRGGKNAPTYETDIPTIFSPGLRAFCLPTGAAPVSICRSRFLCALASYIYTAKRRTPAIQLPDSKIVLADGSEYKGCRFGASDNRVCELVFNTSMVGYQEIVSDPSYTGQLVVMTYPIIGNYGITDEDFETRRPTLGGLVVRECNDIPSNFRYTQTLSEVLEDNGIPGIEGIDTRKLTRAIRDKGSQKALLTDLATPLEEALEILSSTELRHDQVSQVSCKKRWYSRTTNPRFTVVAVDCGIKLNIVRELNRRHCNVTVVPFDTSSKAILDMEPDGIILSNGPGDPTDVAPVVELVRQLRGRFPIFGICLGHQLITLAYGASTYKLKFGHRGGNHPVKNVKTGKLEITSQNHSFAVDENSLKNTDLEVTHVNILDNTLEGVACEKDRVFSVQFHPESAPGPQDSGYLFDDFIRLMEEAKNDA